jgi:hypothetical protein
MEIVKALAVRAAVAEVIYDPRSAEVEEARTAYLRARFAGLTD